MKFIKAFILAFALCTLTPAALAAGGTQAEMRGIEFQLNNSATAGPANALGTRLIKETLHTLKMTYNFATVGGAVSTINMRAEDGAIAKLPKGAIVRNCIIDVITAPTSGGAATIAIGTGQATTDLKSATAIASYTGLVACVPVGTAATAIKLTADRTPSVTIATAALTAGKINVSIEYVISE